MGKGSPIPEPTGETPPEPMQASQRDRLMRGIRRILLGTTKDDGGPEGEDGPGMPRPR
jgi:hypothetical protein